jgi:ABC-type multidrug transport system fused ATPase/permease subunit
MLGTQYPLLDIFWTMLEFFLFFIWIFLIITIFMDIFRSHDMKGFTKFLWVLFIIILPLLGALVYLIARGGSMHERSAQQAKQQEQAFQSYVRQAAGGSSADELAKLTDLKAKGAISDEEFEKAKAKILG